MCHPPGATPLNPPKRDVGTSPHLKKKPTLISGRDREIAHHLEVINNKRDNYMMFLEKKIADNLQLSCNLEKEIKFLREIQEEGQERIDKLRKKPEQPETADPDSDSDERGPLGW